jgi:hypothetical protein
LAACPLDIFVQGSYALILLASVLRSGCQQPHIGGVLTFFAVWRMKVLTFFASDLPRAVPGLTEASAAPALDDAGMMQRRTIGPYWHERANGDCPHQQRRDGPKTLPRVPPSAARPPGFAAQHTER